MLVLAGLPLFLEMAGIGKAGNPLAMRPFLAWRWVAASSKDICSMCRNLALIATMASLAASGFLSRKDWACSGVAEKKMGTRPWANVPSKVSALSSNAPSRTETELSLLKNFFWMLQAAVGRPCISNMGCLVSDMATAHLRQAPFEACVSVLDVEGGLRLFRKYSVGTNWPSPSVIGIAFCL